MCLYRIDTDFILILTLQIKWSIYFKNVLKTLKKIGGNFLGKTQEKRVKYNFSEKIF